MLKQIKRMMVDAADRAGYIVIPNHYYAAVASRRDLRRNQARWARPSSMAGVKMDAEEQLTFLRRNIAPFAAEYTGHRTFDEGAKNLYGPGYGVIEAEALHGVLRWLKPHRIVEIGSGVSTHCMVEAVRMNAPDKTQITCIEPYPSDFLRGSQEIRLIDKQVQDVPLDTFGELTDGDFLFIDSSHAVRTDGDVLQIYLEIIPILAPGVVVHIHDIFMPYAFGPDTLTDRWQWQESALLQALMIDNSRLQTLFCMSYLHHTAPDGLKKIFPDYVPAPLVGGLRDAHTSGHFPASIYLVRK